MIESWHDDRDHVLPFTRSGLTMIDNRPVLFLFKFLKLYLDMSSASEIMI